MANNLQPLASTSSAERGIDRDASVTNDPEIVSLQNWYGEYVQRRLYVEENIKMFNLARIVRELGTREQCVVFATEKGLVAESKNCRIHRKPMNVDYRRNNHVGVFVCSKGQCKGKQISRAKDTWFENVRISMPRVFFLMYCFAHRWSYEQAILEDPEKSEENGCLSMATVADWYSYCRETVVIYHLDQEAAIGKLGGPGKIVQIDESKFGVRKYNKGRRVEGHWVLGFIEDGSEDLRLEVCRDNVRSAEVLVPLIKKHVHEGTTIHTDYWKAYDCLGQHGFEHKKVNHSDPDNPFVAPDGTHTQRIESQWRVVKRFFIKDNYNHPSNFADLIVEYLWRRWVLRNKKDPFLELVRAINYVYGIK